MAKEDLMTLEGLIDEIYPDGRFGVMLEKADLEELFTILRVGSKVDLVE